MAQLVLETGAVFGDSASVPAKAQRHRQHGQVRREQTTQLHQRPAGTIGSLQGIGPVAALRLAPPATGPSGGRLVVAVVGTSGARGPQ